MKNSKKTFVIGIILIISAMLIINAVRQQVMPDDMFRNRKGKIVKLYTSDGKTQGKFSHMVSCKAVLIQDLIDTTLYVELTTCDYNPVRNSDGRGVAITNEWFYNHYEGDTVHFDFISKDRYFHITRRSPL